MGDRHAAAVRLTDVEGAMLAATFGDTASEYRALRETTGLVDAGWLARLDVRGEDTVPFLQGMLSNDVKALVPGTGCPALLLTEQGKVVADLMVLADASALALDGNALAVRAAQAALERFIVADDVELTPAGDEHVVALIGPTAADVLARLGAPVPAAPFAHVRAQVESIAVHVVRVPAPGIGGFLCHVAPNAVDRLWERCVGGGAVAAGFDAFDAVRIESGVPWHGRDVVADTLALEAPYEAAISFRKGCYLGQEVMERVMARGHVNRKLVGLVLAGEHPPPAGTRLRSDAREVGWITSAAWSPRRSETVALGYVRREHSAPGTTLTAGEPLDMPATVHALPF